MKKWFFFIIVTPRVKCHVLSQPRFGITQLTADAPIIISVVGIIFEFLNSFKSIHTQPPFVNQYEDYKLSSGFLCTQILQFTYS